MRRRSLFITTIVGVVVCALYAWESRARTHVRVTTAGVSDGAIVRRIIATGTLQAVTTVQVGSQVSGTIALLAADFNTVVHKGQVLAKLDPSLFEAEVRQAEAALAQANANMMGFEVEVEDARTKLTRAEQLSANQLIPESDLDGARIVMDQANADLAAGTSQVSEIAFFEVDSYPDEIFDGTVSAVRLQPVATQTAVAAAAGTSVGTTDTTTVATVTSYATMIDVKNADEKLRPGMTALVTLDGSRRDSAVRIPNGALSFRPPPEVLGEKGSYAFLKPSDEATRLMWRYDGQRFASIPVRTGLMDEQWTELIGNGLRPGDELVTSASLGQ